MPIELSFLLCLRNDEARVATMVRAAHSSGLAALEAAKRSPRLEILALDQDSTDNTLSALSVLQHKVEGLSTVPGIVPGEALARGSQLAQGRLWAIVDRPFDEERAAWALHEAFEGACAVVPGELLVLSAEQGRDLLQGFRGGLVRAQRKAQTSEARVVLCPSERRGLRCRLHRSLRARASRLLPRLDKA